MGALLTLLGKRAASPPVNTVLPAITGTPTEGETLTAVPGTFTGTVTSRAYQWNRAGVPIVDADDLTYVPVADDVGSVLTFTDTATNAGGSTSATSAGTEEIAFNPDLVPGQVLRVLP